jgi:hypothetical protein
MLGFETAEIVNLFAIPSRSVTDISMLGAELDGWTEARALLEPAIIACSGVLLGYGVAEPKGAARRHHRDQVDWLGKMLADTGRPTFQVGGEPRHPSRWQRWTARHYPHLTFSSALRSSFGDINGGSIEQSIH